MGSYVVGIPTEALEEYRKEHPMEVTDAAFRNLISETEMRRMKDSLAFINLLLVEWIPFVPKWRQHLGRLVVFRTEVTAVSGVVSILALPKTRLVG